MKKKILKMAVVGIAALGLLTVAYGASRNKFLDEAVYINNDISGSRDITMEKAKSIALAQVPGANESNIVEIDFDEHHHGRMVYEIEILYNNSKHEFEIDASTGEIIGMEVKHH